MRKFFSAILNEWRQHWRLLLIIFVANVCFFGWAVTGHCPGEHMMMLIYSPLVFLTCVIPPVVMAPNLLNDAAKPPAPTSSAILYWTKFIAGITPFVLFTMLVFIVCFIVPHSGFDYEFALLILAFISMGAGVSSLIFFISLTMPKTRRLIVLIMALLETLLLFILLAPGLMGGIALFGTNFFIQETISKMTVFHFIAGDYEGAWGYLIALAAFSFLTPCIVILPSLGYLLWTKKIVTGKEYLKLLRLGICMLLLAAFALWFIAIKNGQARLFQAERNARAEGILYDPEQIRLTPPVPAERNAARLYYKAFKTLKELNQKNYNDYLYYNLESLRTQEDRQRLIDFILSPEGKQILALIEQAEKYPKCRFIPQITGRTTELFEFEMSHLVHFVLAQAYVYKITGQENKVLPEVSKSFQLAEIINNQPFRSSLSRNMGVIEDTVCNVIKICPENSASVASYRKMLDYLTQYNIHSSHSLLEYGYDYYSRMLSLQCTFDDGRCWRNSDSNSFSKTMLWADLFIGYPLVLRYFANYVDDNVKVRREMLKIQKMPVLPPELSWQYKGEFSRTNYNMLLRFNGNQLFRARSMREMLRIGLALKIYKCEHGKYPASLQELVPAILPTIPTDPINDKSFGYKLERGNFILKDNSNTPRELSSEFKLNP